MEQPHIQNHNGTGSEVSRDAHAVSASFDVPILFIVFNRPDTTRLVFEEIKKIRPTQVYIAGDAAREHKTGENEAVEQVREFLRVSIDWPCDVKTLYHEQNVGCRKAVSSAVTWFFEHVDEGIILEDDCVPDQTFFSFCKTMLETYRNDERIMHIGGSNFQQGKKRGDASYYFSRYNHIWGWATWRRAWNQYDVDMKDYPEFVESQKIKTIWPKKSIQNIWLKKFESVYDKKIDTWDYQWTYAIWKHDGICILPNQNLVSNIGFGSGATHTKRKDIYADMPRASMPTIVHPNTVEIHTQADEFYNKHFLFFYRVINKLKAYLLKA